MTKASWLGAFAIAFLVSMPAHSENYPSRPIRLILASAPGGSPHTHARLMANELTKQMGQQVVVENRPGASSVIGLEHMAKAVPDGYSIGYAAFPVATNPSMFSKLPYDFARDFQPVVHQLSAVNILT